MLRWKTTLFFLVLTIGVGAYISLYEIRRPLPEERESRAKQLVNVTPESVTQLVLDLPPRPDQSRGGRTTVTLTRSGSAWILAPNHVRADSDLIGRILNQLSPLAAERVLAAAPEQPLDPKAYGLEPAVGWLSVVSDAAATTLLIGEPTPVHHNRYMKLANRPEIFVVSSQLFETANVPAETFRDPFLFRLDSWLADELTLTSASQVFSLIRRENDWLLTRPLNDRADRAAVNALLSRLGQLPIARFVDDAPTVERVREWGLDQPRAEVRVQERGNPQPVTVFFGAPLPDDASLVYAKRSDEPSLYAVASTHIEALLANPNTLRSTACFEFFTTGVRKVEVTRQEARWTIERTDGQWRAEGSTTRLDARRVEELLNKLADMRLITFVEEAPSELARYGLEPPRGTIAVWTTDHDQPQRLVVGLPVEGAQERYGRIEGRAAVITLPALVTDLLATTPDQLK